MKQDNDDIEFNVVQAPDIEPASSVAASSSDTGEEKTASGDMAEVQQDTLEETEEQDSQEISIEELVKEDAKEEDTQPASSFSLNKALGGAMLAKFIQHQFWLVMLIAFFLIIYISARYWCQQDMVQIDKKEKELVSIHYKATVFTSKMTEQSRQSNIMEMLGQRGDSTLEIPTVPPYKIYIPE